MSTLEATVGVVKLLSEENLVKVQYVARHLLMNQNDTMLNEEVLTKQRFLEALEISRHQTKNRQCINAKEAIDNIRNRYGL